MARLDDAIRQVQLYISTLPGVKGAPQYPPEQLSDFPFSVCYPGDGMWVFGPALDKRGLHNIVVEIHTGRKTLPESVKAVINFVEDVPNLLMNKLQQDNKWNSTIDTFGAISYTFGPLGWNDAPTIGWRFRIEAVKMQSTIT